MVRVDLASDASLIEVCATLFEQGDLEFVAEADRPTLVMAAATVGKQTSATTVDDDDDDDDDGI